MTPAMTSRGTKPTAVVSIGLSLMVTLICAVIGYPIAFYLVRHAGRWIQII